MRINPLGTFREVQKLINLPASGQAGALEFSDTLATLTPKTEQIQPIVQTTVPAELPASELRAKVAFPAPQLLTAPLELQNVPVEPHSEEHVEPKVEEESVRSPTLISAKRVSIPDPYAGMSRLEREEAVAQLVREAGARHGIDPVLSMAVVSAESSFNPNAISNDGHESKGLMQLLDSTGRAQLNLAEVSQEYDPFHPPLNVDLGVQYLRQLHDMFGTQTSITNQLSTIPAANSSSLEKLAVAAYNAGQGRVASAQQRAARAGNDAAEYSVVEPYLPQSTQEYVKRVMQRRETYEARFGVLANESTT